MLLQLLVGVVDQQLLRVTASARVRARLLALALALALAVSGPHTTPHDFAEPASLPPELPKVGLPAN